MYLNPDLLNPVAGICRPGLVLTERPLNRVELVTQIEVLEELLRDVAAEGDAYSLAVAAQLRSLLTQQRSALAQGRCVRAAASSAA